MTSKYVRSIVCIALVGFWAEHASALVLFSDNFNTNTSASWTVNTAPTGTTIAGQQQATFAYDYSAMGIPPAPGSSDTLGLRLRANIPGSAAAPVLTRPSQTLSGLSVSPTGQNFGASYQMTFYAWSNFFGAPNATGLADNGNSQGGTNNVLFAVGTAGNVPLVVAGNAGLAADGVMDGIGFATTGDGGITSDYRVYPKSGTVADAASGDYAAGTANDTEGRSPLSDTNLYYQGIATLAPHTAPAIQQTLSTAEFNDGAFNTQAGSTQIGAFGFAWHQVVLTKNGNSVTWDIDDNRIATVDVSALAMGGNNIALGESDVNATTAQHPSLLFTVFDNLTITDVPVAIPGDFDSSHVVDGADAVTWRKNVDTNNALPNDNGLGIPIGDAHFNLWRANYGNPNSPAAGSEVSGTGVPEPATILTFLFGALAIMPGRKRSKEEPGKAIVSWTSLMIAGLMCVLASPAFANPNLGIVSTDGTTGTGGSSGHLDGSGNWVWTVLLTPDLSLVPDASGTPLAAELGFTSSSTGAAVGQGNLLGAYQTAAEFANFVFLVPGKAIFPAWQTNANGLLDPNSNNNPTGIQLNASGVGTNAGASYTTNSSVSGSANQVFAALLSENFTVAGVKSFIDIHVQRPVVTTLNPITTTTIKTSGVYGTGGTNGRLTQVTGLSGTTYTSSNFDTFGGAAYSFTMTAKGGDADLDGQINFHDYQILANNYDPNYNPTPSSAHRWYQGDFDGNGIVNFTDYQILVNAFGADSNYLVGPVTPGAGSGLTSVSAPEPASIALLGLALLGGLGVVRRKR